MEDEVSKKDIYEALYGLHSGVDQFNTSLECLERSGLGIAFLSGYRLVLEQIRAGITTTILEVVTEIERRDQMKLEKRRAPPQEKSKAE
jgi:hypothetical protein